MRECPRLSMYSRYSKAIADAIEKYIGKRLVLFDVSDSVYLAALVLLDRLTLSLTPRNAHRLFLSAFLVATKFVEDDCYDNSFYAACGGGVTTTELNGLERNFLRLLEFRAFVSSEEIALCDALTRRRRRRKRRKTTKTERATETPAQGFPSLPLLSS